MEKNKYIVPCCSKAFTLSISPLCNSYVTGSGDAIIDYGGIDKDGEKNPSAKSREDEEDEELMMLLSEDQPMGLGLW